MFSTFLKLSNALYFIRNAKNLKSLYYSLFHCLVIYAIQIWSCTARSNFKDIVIKQKKAVRIVADAAFNAHAEPLFKKLYILPSKNLILFFN
jgi:hypothetical protein